MCPLGCRIHLNQGTRYITYEIMLSIPNWLNDFGCNMHGLINVKMVKYKI